MKRPAPQAVDSLFHSRARGGAFKQGPQDKLYKLAELCRDSGMTDRMLNLLAAYLRLKPARVRRDFRHFLSLVARDKKARGASNRFVLIAGPGRLAPAEDLDAPLLKLAFEGALK